MRARWGIAAAIAVFWIAECLYAAAWLHVRRAASPRPVTWTEAFHSEVLYALGGALLTPLALSVASRVPFDRHRWRVFLAVHVPASAVFPMLVKTFWDLTFLGGRTPWISSFSVSRLLRSATGGFDSGFVIYWLGVVGWNGYVYWRRYESERLEAAELRNALMQAQLRTLRVQLAPHFFFNALHGISQLIHESPHAAEEMIAKLGALLRRSLDASGLQEVPLAEELDFLEQYLDIERTRFAGRLTVEYAIDPEARQTLVPSFLLQPLAENAIRHGLRHRTEQARLRIAASLADSRLVLSVADNGSGIAPSPLPVHEGVGTRSVRGRLRQLYGDDQELTFAQVDGGLTVTVSIPRRSVA